MGYKQLNQRGSAVVLALIMLILMMLMAFGFIALTTIETSIAHNESDYVRSLYAAEAGISEALYRTNCNIEEQVTVNGVTFYPYIATFTLTDDRGTANPIDNLYWHNDKIDNNGNGTIDEWGEVDPAWTANIWLTTPGTVPSTPAWTSSRKYFYYPTIMELISYPSSDVLKYSSTMVEDFTLSYRYKKFNNGKVVFIKGDGEFEQPVACDQEGSPVVIIESTGQYATLQRTVQVEAYPEIKPVFDVSMCGCTALKIGGTGTIIDSYNSTAGLYPAALGQKGDVGSNEFINITGSPNIYGDMTAGTYIDADNVTCMGGARAGEYVQNGTFGADIEEYVSPEPRPCPCDELRMAIDMDYYEFNNDNASIGLTDLGQDPFRGTPYHMDLRNKDNLTLFAGNYYFDSISLGSQCTLTTNGRVYIYLRQSSDLTGGGIINASKKPTDLVIYSTAEIINIGGESSFYGALFAPWADVKTAGNSDFFGALLGNDLTNIGTADFHYDEALALIGIKFFTKMKKISWREIK